MKIQKIALFAMFGMLMTQGCKQIAQTSKTNPQPAIEPAIVDVKPEPSKHSEIYTLEHNESFHRSPQRDVKAKREYKANAIITPMKPAHTEEAPPILDNNKEVFTSTFSIDVDNASYSNARNLLMNYNRLPDSTIVRLEEMVNYFDYNYPSPKVEDKDPFSVYTEIASAPWDEKKQLLHIGIQGKKLDYENLKPSNLVFLIDVSGSMNSTNKLPLLRDAFKLMVEKLRPTDRVAIVAYAGAAGLVLPSVPASDKRAINNALNALQSGGSTAGGAGIQLAYKVAVENFIPNGNNRVILATDGDFNVGTSSTADLLSLIEEKRKSNVFLTALAFGEARFNDDMLETITNAGNGNYFYIDGMAEARKVFEKEMLANLFTLAKDVKIQVEFNPAVVKSFKLVGYDNRRLENKDFNDDKKDAGELGAGHSVTALYEVVLQPNVDKDKTMLELRLRYKPIKSDKSELISHKVLSNPKAVFANSSNDFKFAAAVTAWGMMLDQKIPTTALTFEMIKNLAAASAQNDPHKLEFIELVKKSQQIAGV